MKYVIANWKSNKNLATATQWLEELGQVKSNHEAILLPAFNLLGAISERATAQGFKLGVQDLSPFAAGSYTGAISTLNLEGMGAKYALLGHSERRRYFAESDQDVANKAERALDAGLIPIICVDEGYIESQAAALEQNSCDRCLIVYEPLSAIGSGDEMNADKVEAVFARIKEAFGDVKVLYGGSVDSTNIWNYMAIGDGVLVGTASLEAEEFKKLL